MTKTPTNLKPAIKELHKFYDKANEVLFKGVLPEIVITMQSRGNRKGVLGWFVTKPIWETGTEDLYEINIVPEAMNRDYMEILQTMLHEMIHVYCAVKGIKETSRNGSYHNKRFSDTANMFGMVYPESRPCSRIGYSAVILKPETIQLIKSWKISKKAFTISRKDLSPSASSGQKKKTNIIKWTCPACGDIVRSSKADVKMMCMNDKEKDGETEKAPCMQMFVAEL